MRYQALLVTEATFWMSFKMSSIVRKTPTVSPAEFFEKSEPCDILVVFTPRRFIKQGGIREWLKMVTSTTLMGSPYSSTKIIESKKTVWGYGVKGDLDNVEVLGSLEKDEYWKYVKDLSEAILIRVPNLTELQKKSILSFIKERHGLSYSTSDLLKTIWNRLTLGIFGRFFKKLGRSEINAFQAPLFCSTIVSMAFAAAGVKMQFSRSPQQVLPKDFVLHPDTIKVCKIDIPRVKFKK
jgi:hypothetical protein